MKKNYTLHVVCAVVAIGMTVGAYFLGKSQTSDDGTAALMHELDSLRSHEGDAAVVKRVSQQMESIAYQQKAISDKQRDKAEEQSRFAMEMRDRAEHESHVARQAEDDAVLAAQVASQQRELALVHQKTAEQQRDRATLAKNIADTLTRRSLGRTLGNTASTQFENGNKNLADFLALLAWTYLKDYGGNTYQPEVFKALCSCTGTRWEVKTHRHGAVMDVSPIGDGGFVGVSDYGEVELCKNGEQKTTVLFQNREYDFHAVMADKSYVYAVSAHGPLVVLDYNGTARTVVLPEDRYWSIMENGGGDLILVGERNVCRFDKATKTVAPLCHFNKTLTSLTWAHDRYYLFFSDGSCSEMSSGGTVKARKPFVSGVVTCACYDKNNGCLFLGTKTGDLYFINRHGLNIANLEGHTSEITTLSVDDGVLVSGAYDKTVLVWNLSFLFLDGFGSYKEALNATQRTKTTNDEGTARREWLMPVAFTYTGWPLTSCVTKYGNVVIGTSAGVMQSINISTESMASMLRARKPETKVSREELTRYLISTSEL